MTCIEDAQRECLETIKSMHSDMKTVIASENGADTDKIKEWKSIVHQLYKDLNAIRKRDAMETELHNSTVSIMREEMRDELVQREAIAARTAERFRVFCSRGTPQIASAFDRAARTASSIDASVNALSCSSLMSNQGTVILHQQATSTDV